jgi:hypothetical protein
LKNAGAGSTPFEAKESQGTLLVEVPWVSQDPITGTLAAYDQFTLDVTFTALPTMTIGTYNAALEIHTDDAVTPSFRIPLTLTVQGAQSSWQKLVLVNTAPITDTSSPIPAVPSDTVTIADRVWITYTPNITFTLVEQWDAPLNLRDYRVVALPDGTVGFPGSEIITNSGTLTWMISNAPSAWSYVLTKTFTVVNGPWISARVTESLSVVGAASQPNDVLLQFQHAGGKLYMPVILRGF